MRGLAVCTAAYIDELAQVAEYCGQLQGPPETRRGCFTVIAQRLYTCLHHPFRAVPKQS